MKKYILKNHLGIVAILISIFVPLSTIVIQYNIDQKEKTKTYYFANSFDSNNKNKLFENVLNCWTRSAASNRSDAYRCMAENYIYDPCFLDPFNVNVAVCPDTPHTFNKYFKLKLDKSVLNEKISSQDSYPWYIKLSDGVECNFITGATVNIADKRMDYGCAGFKETDRFLLLPITNEDGLLKIGCMVNGKIEECNIKEVWY